MLSNGKPCTNCKVGWMVFEIVRDALGVLRRVYYCSACGHMELVGEKGKATE